MNDEGIIDEDGLKSLFSKVTGKDKKVVMKDSLTASKYIKAYAGLPADEIVSKMCLEMEVETIDRYYDKLFPSEAGSKLLPRSGSSISPNPGGRSISPIRDYVSGESATAAINLTRAATRAIMASGRPRESPKKYARRSLSTSQSSLYSVDTPSYTRKSVVNEAAREVANISSHAVERLTRALLSTLT